MEFNFVIIIFLLIINTYLIISKFRENFETQKNDNPMYFFQDVTDLHLNTGDSHYFLTQDINVGDQYINNLKGYSTLSHKATDPIDLKTPIEWQYRKFIQPEHFPEQEIDDRTLGKVLQAQPMMFSYPEIVNYYGGKYYYDSTYPETLINIDYLNNPEEYCRTHPSVYPCPRRASRF